MVDLAIVLTCLSISTYFITSTFLGRPIFQKINKIVLGV